MYSAKVTSKGQITIPVEIRESMGLEPGNSVTFFPTGEGDFVMRARTGSIMDLRGCLAGLGVPGNDQEMNEILHQRALELDEATKSDAQPLSDGEAA
ncbi:MAG TPA: AbrB/MazE/SpoVT family DNA-binding domain-containing protein [Terracidiphilus sp.]|nr:AbrB/MazE/SpoVT family DNA-binding domain-containing protein [Terracidiphilus sp.]